MFSLQNFFGLLLIIFFYLKFAPANNLIRVFYFIVFYFDVLNDNIVLLKKKYTRRIFFIHIYSQNSGVDKTVIVWYDTGGYLFIFYITILTTYI